MTPALVRLSSGEAHAIVNIKPKRRIHRFPVRLTAEERTALELEAARSGTTITEVLRRAIPKPVDEPENASGT